MKTKYPLHPHTFGATPASVTLAAILSELQQDRLTGKVSTYLTEHNTLLRNISEISDIHSRLTLINLIGEKIKLFSPNWPVKVLSYTKNVALSLVKKHREYDESVIKSDISASARERALKNKEQK